MEQSAIVRNKMVRAAGLMLGAMKGVYKTWGQFPPEAVVFFQGVLAFLKSHHSHAEAFSKIKG